MGRFRSLVVIGAAIVAGVACASRPVVPPQNLDDLRQTRAPAERHRKTPLVAPPPAYGNKVVDGLAAEPPATDIANATTGMGDRL